MDPSGYSLLDFGDTSRLEQWGPYRLIRPDPTAMGEPMNRSEWDDADATYVGEKGKGAWLRRTEMPDAWDIAFDDFSLRAKLTPYKHTGIFPEQQENWRWARAESRRLSRPLSVLSLFAYTGGMTVALAKDGHAVTHVDASKPAVAWAKENAALNQLAPDAVRWIIDDAAVFAARERKRGKTYDALVLDPPAFGHSPSGKTWKVEKDLAPLLEDCCALLSPEPAFVVLNGYAQHATADSFKRLLGGVLLAQGREKFRISAAELLLRTSDDRTLSTGIVARCGFAKL